MTLRCEECGKTNSKATRYRKINPRNFHETIALLCPPCAKKGKWSKLDLGRKMPVHGHTTAAKLDNLNRS